MAPGYRSRFAVEDRKQGLLFPAVLLAVLWAALPALGQAPCGCEQDEAIDICYLSIEDYCHSGSTFLNCEYSFDGIFMESGLVAKLQNSQNFGPGGIAGCEVALKRLPPITGVETLDSCDCDIVFIGQFPVGLPSGELDLSISTVPDATLETIREWSALCESNLVIVTQAEANPWGYITENENINPNRPAGEVSISIFDGAFGALASFQQGGAFQGVFTRTPSTGAEILAKDALGRPTVVLDAATNDIILADVGILCSNGAGEVTVGGGVFNNNDILACNLFALGCRIAEGISFSNAQAMLCPGDSTLLPDGAFVSLPGRYVDTLVAANGCDSLIETEVRVMEVDTVLFSPPLCEGDVYSITLNGNTYDVNNPVGEEVLLTEQGCDSVVRVSLFYAPLSYDTVRVSGCRGDGFSLNVGGVVYNENNPSGQEVLANRWGCDSTVTIGLFFEPQDTSLLDFERCEGEQLVFDGKSYEAGTTTALSFPTAGNCDSVVVIRVAANPLPKVGVDSVEEVTLGEPFAFDYGLAPDLQAQWSPADALSCPDCPAPELLPGKFPGLVQLTVVDSKGCSSSYDIAISYICNPYIPNAFSPNDDGRNDRFRAYFACPIEGFRLEIYGRWGGLIYQTEDPGAGWDGRINGRPAPAGVYAYVVTIRENGREKTASGEVNLLR